ncbi:hypothetical protein ACEXQD_13975 [Herbiconiux sp. P15]|uniref:hypothetical protein n=1 Tax=Herbiconiux liukaitaii TaxID=3342799 RepID=UPI0035B80251
MSDRFGLNEIGSVEIFHEEAVGWSIRAFSGPSRTGKCGSHASFSPDDDGHLGVTALLTVSAVLAADNHATAGDWHVDEPGRVIWIDVELATEQSVSNSPSLSSVEAVMDAASHWLHA